MKIIKHLLIENFRLRFSSHM